MKDKFIIPIFVPDLEESSNSIFDCESNKLNKSITAKEVTEVIEKYLEKDKKEAEKEIVFLGGCFTAIDKQKQEELLSIANQYMREGKIKSISISTMPNYINKDVLKILKKYKVKTIELEVASTNDYLLKRVEQKYNFEDIKKASKLIRRYGFSLVHKLAVGLPESTKLDEINTAKELIKLKPKIVEIYPVLVIKRTKLEEEFENGEYEPLTVVQAVECCKELTYIFNKKRINLIKIGWQNISNEEDTENENNQIIAGPYHTNFKQLVESSIWYDSIVEKIKKFDVKVKEVEIVVNPQDFDNAVGYNKENIDKLKEYYSVEAKVIKKQEIKIGKIEVNIIKKFTDFLDDKEKINV